MAQKARRKARRLAVFAQTPQNVVVKVGETILPIRRVPKPTPRGPK